MIKKERKIPIIILQYEALLRRIPANHPKRPHILEELAKSKAGFNGEKSLDYQLSSIDQKKYHIFHDLRLSSEDRNFQIDSLIASKNLFIVLEIKNISGTLYFDEKFSQLIRTKNGEETGFLDPFLQVVRQETLLRKLILQHKITCPPIKSFIVISNPSTIIKPTSKMIRNGTKIIHSATLPLELKNLETNHQTPILSDKELKKLSSILMKKNTLLIREILSKFKIKESELIKGVYCTKCLHLPISRFHYSWVCPKCSGTSRKAYIHSLIDYALLVSSEITNKQMREFLQISSDTSALNLLRILNIDHTGETKGRRYHLTSLIERYRDGLL
ncbi:MAG: nuclease-related domain-containing protein [Bacillota bacterium]